MSLLHPALLAGLGLALIPILLHLMLRAKPKRLIFPALRLIEKSRRQNVRRLQLRHLWLLLLRMLLIALIVVAVARPSLPAANYSLLPSEWIGLLAILAAGIGCYAGLLAWWTRHNRPRTWILTRRTYLRGIVGLVTAALILLGIGWPYAKRVAADIKSPAPKAVENIPIAAIFLFDASPRMGYRQGNQTRLQFAQQVARDHLGRLPSGSKLAIADSNENSSPAFSLDLQAAISRIDAREVKTSVLALNDRLRTMLMAQEDDRRRITAEQSGPEDRKQDRYLREIYLFTDLTRSGWREDTSSALANELKRLPFVSVYLIDVGEIAPNNVGISSVKLSRETMSAGGTLRVDAVVSSVGNVKTDQTLELLLGGTNGKLIKQRQIPVSVVPGTETTATFEIPNVAVPYQQGEVRISGSDPLAIDDAGYFTVKTLPQLKIAIVGESPAEVRYWQETLNDIAAFKITDYATEFIPASQFSGIDLTLYDVVCLINVKTPEETDWKRLRDYVEGGGGLCVFLGAENLAIREGQREGINPVWYNSAVAQNVLPAELKATLNHKPPQVMDLRNSQHPFLKRLEDLSALGELGAIEIHRYWKVEPHPEAILIANYSQSKGAPALIERRIGQGRVVMMTTGVNLKWNDFVQNGWFFVLADQLMQYLSHQTSQHCNYLIGSEVTLPLDRKPPLKKVVFRMPDFKQRTQEIPPEARELTLRDLTTLGSYQVDSVAGDVDYHAGFSINLSARDSDLKRLETSDLDSLLGEGRYALSRDPQSLERMVQTGRLGQEMYSLVVALLVAIFALEQFTATWFYKTDEA